MIIKNIFSSIFLILFFYSLSFGIILYPELENNNIPINNYFKKIVGRWGNNASCVVIHPEYIITTSHQGGDINTIVEINSTPYSISQIFKHPIFDITIAKLNNANFSNFSILKQNLDTSILEKEIYITGFGKGRGDNYYRNEQFCGYYWKNEGNINFRLGTNKVRTILGNSLYYDFDELESINITSNECSVSQYDSGGGSFLYEDGFFYLIGIHVSVNSSGYSSFCPTNAVFEDHNIASYYEWIEEIIPSVELNPPSDFNKDGTVDIYDLCLFFENWLFEGESNIDINKDEIINLHDFQFIKKYWMTSSTIIY